jgi:hypothetical protein
MSRPTGPYEVVTVLPVGENNSPTYRVKNKAEPFARSARKAISSRSDAAKQTDGGAMG